MPKFFLHVHEVGIAIDKEGIELPSVEAAFAEATLGLRDIVSERVLNGVLFTCLQVIIADEVGNGLGEVTFNDAIKVVPQAHAHG